MVRAIMIVEMMGRPAGHLIEMLEKHIGILNDVKDIEVHSIKVREPRVIETEKKVDEGEEMWTAFAEADFECDSFARLSETMFDFMPSSVEVIEPGKVVLDMNEATGLLNNISGRLHRYDEIAKVLGERYKQMEAALGEVSEALKDRDAKIARLRKRREKVVKKKVEKKKVVKKKK